MVQQTILRFCAFESQGSLGCDRTRELVPRYASIIRIRGGCACVFANGRGAVPISSVNTSVVSYDGDSN